MSELKSVDTRSTSDVDFSIVMPTFNRADRIANAIESVQTQNYPNWELIIVNDGGSDHTQEVIRKYVGDQRIRYFYCSHRGRSAARNFGVQRSTGDYICFLDDDDLFMPEHLYFLKQAIGGLSNPSLIYTGYRIIRNNTEIVGTIKRKKSDYLTLWYNFMPVNAFCINRALLTLEKWPEQFSFWEDKHWLLRVLRHCSLVITNARTAIVTEHTGRSVNTYGIQELNTMLEAMDHLGKVGMYNNIPRYMFRRMKCSKCIERATNSLVKHDVINAKKALKMAGANIVLRFLPRFYFLQLKLLFLGITAD